METVKNQQPFFLYVEDDASNRKVMQLIIQKALETARHNTS